MPSKVWLYCLCVLCLHGANHANAEPGRYTSAEYAQLPAYCSDSEDGPAGQRGSARWNYWIGRMGPYFGAIHHYCRGMVAAMQAQKLGKNDLGRHRLYRRAIAEYDFILGNSGAKSFVLLPEIFVRRAEAAVQVEDWGLANESYAEARGLKPDYWPAFLGWAEVLAKAGERSEARALLLQGLTHSPTAEPLRRLYVQVGGSLKDIPEPKPAAPADEAASAPAGGEPASAAASAASAAQ